ncbi:hypothetical protein NSU08_39160 [Paenibacillus sp. FSL H7-0331]|uniref:hypothetical protein n=1 Tax=Paenibacillus sp. FSL H7-0331 TaxID=1920421 RepID=UPI0030F7C33A
MDYNSIFYIVNKPDVTWAHGRKVKRISEWINSSASFKFEESSIGWSKTHIFYFDELQSYEEIK